MLLISLLSSVLICLATEDICYYDAESLHCGSGTYNTDCYSVWGLQGGSYCDVDNKCKCYYPYDKTTCLPHLNGCKICQYNNDVSNIGTALGTDSYFTQYACQNNQIKSLTKTEIRVVGVHESSNGQHSSWGTISYFISIINI